MKLKYQLPFFISVILLFLCSTSSAQNIIDDCFTSVAPGTNLTSSSDLANMGNAQADMLQWTGTTWIGDFASANLNIPPPTNQVNCRAVFLGNGTTWTTGGEGFGLRLDSPLVAGNSYTFDITYVSHGTGSDGAFSPRFYTNAIPSLTGAFSVGNLPAAGNNWTTNSYTFVATATQAGHNWIIMHSTPTGSSGLVNSFCVNCNTNVIPTCNVTVNNPIICQSGSTNVIATPETSGNFTYDWTVPIGVINPGNVSTFLTSVIGNYSVIITNIDTNCVSPSASGTVTTAATPIVTVNSAIICQGSTTNILATPNASGNYSYSWTVPTGFTNPGNVITFPTSTAGTYTVIITNTDTNCVSTSASGTVTISPTPIAIVNSPSICQGATAILLATPNTSGNYSYAWTVPSGVTNPGNVITFSTTVAGTYSVIITNTDTNCISTSASGIVTILPTPIVTINNSVICEGNAANITATPNTIGNYSYVWTVPATVTNPGNVNTFSTTTAGTYSVIITNTDTNCVSASASGTVVVATIPIVSVNDASICQGNAVNITATPNTIGNYSYAWTVPISVTNPGNVNTFSTTTEGTYSVIITNTDTNCVSASATGTVFVSALPTVSVNDASICQGNAVNITATPNVIGNYLYTWTVPITVANPGNVNTFSTTTAGNYSVIITNSDTNCVSASASGTVIISPTPSVSVNSETICQGDIVNVTATPNTSENFSYAWTVPTSVINPGNVNTFSTSNTGIYSVIITNIATNCSSASVSGTIDFLPSFDFTIKSECVGNKFILEVIPTNNSFNAEGATYNWNLTTASIGNATTLDVTTFINSTTIIEQLPLEFTITVTVNGCSKSYPIMVESLYCEIQKGISPNDDNKNDFFDLRLLSVSKLEIFNRYGIKVYEKKNYTDEWRGQSNKGNDLPDATYYYLIEFNNNQAPKTGWIYINREY